MKIYFQACSSANNTHFREFHEGMVSLFLISVRFYSRGIRSGLYFHMLGTCCHNISCPTEALERSSSAQFSGFTTLHLHLKILQAIPLFIVVECLTLGYNSHTLTMTGNGAYQYQLPTCCSIFHWAIPLILTLILLTLLFSFPILSKIVIKEGCTRICLNQLSSYPYIECGSGW